MDIKSVIKTFAEAWAAASLKIEQNQANIPSLYSQWRPFPTPASVSELHQGKVFSCLQFLSPDIVDLTEPLGNLSKGRFNLASTSDVGLVSLSVSVDSWIMMANGSLTLLSSEMLLSF